MSKHRRVGILGGTFDPIHCGHVDLGAAAQSALSLTDLLVIPVSVPPHRQPPRASAFHRFAMVSLAVAGRACWRASDLEVERGARSYTSATLQQLHERGYEPKELFVVLGADAFVEIEAWRGYPQLLTSAHFVVVSRPGLRIDDLPRRLPALTPHMMQLSGAEDAAVPTRPMIFLIDAPTADVSATAIRSRRASGESIAGMVPPAVEQHIEQHDLYLATIKDGDLETGAPSTGVGRLHGQS